jgi:hypothetical protein
MGDLTETNAPSTLDAAKEYLKEGGGYDVAVAAAFLTQGVPIPPSIVKRFRVGVERLIDGGFDIASGSLARIKARSDFNANLQQQVVEVMAQAGAQNLAQKSPAISNTVALSMLNEYGLKFANKAAVGRQAFEELANDPPLVDEVPEASIDVDWLNYFSDIAAQKSGPEMQRLMGRILAGEIRKPGSFSPMTVNILSTLTPEVAQKFEQLCSVAVQMNGMSLILTSVFPDFATKGIPEIGFTYVDLLTLRSHQLLANETGSTWTMTQGSASVMVNCARTIILFATGSGGDQAVPSSLFSQAGNEMRRLVSPTPPTWFEEKLSSVFVQPKWKLEIRAS